MKPRPKFTVLDDHGNEIALQAKFVVCPRCEGTGVHDHPAFSNGLGPEELEDPDFREAYLDGQYDVRCEECKGERVVPHPDMENLNADELRWLEDHWKARAEAREERRMRDRGIEF